MAETEFKSASDELSADVTYREAWEFANNLQSDIQDDRDSLLVAATNWGNLCCFIKMQEQRLLILPDPKDVDPHDVAEHKRWSEMAISAGDRIIAALDSNGIELAAPNGRAELENVLKNVHFDFRMRHLREEVSLEESDAFIKAAFS